MNKKLKMLVAVFVLATSNYVSAAAVTVEKDVNNNIYFDDSGNVIEYDANNRVHDNLILGENNSLSKYTPNGTSEENIIVGGNNDVTGTHETVTGHHNVVQGSGDVVLGDYNNVSGNLGVYNVVIGRNNTVENSSSSIAIGSDVSIDGYRSIAIGDNATVIANQALAIGDGASASGGGSTALGDHASASGLGAVSVGPYAQATGQQSIATGVYSVASGDYFMANGRAATALGESSTALGRSAKANNDNDVALGSFSETATVINTQGTTIRGQYYQFAGTNAQSTVSIGSTGNERTLTNVAAGRISADSTDAINGSQLYATNQAVENLEVNTGNLSNRVDNMQGSSHNIQGEIKSVGALSAAIASLKPIQYDPNNKSQMMAGVGTYRGEQAMDVGLGYYFNEKTFAHVGGAFDFGGSSPMWNAGIAFKFGGSKRKDNINPMYGTEPITSIQIIQKENTEMKVKMDRLEKENDNLKQRLETLESILLKGK